MADTDRLSSRGRPRRENNSVLHDGNLFVNDTLADHDELLDGHDLDSDGGLSSLTSASPDRLGNSTNWFHDNGSNGTRSMSSTNDLRSNGRRNISLGGSRAGRSGSGSVGTGGKSEYQSPFQLNDWLEPGDGDDLGGLDNREDDGPGGPSWIWEAAIWIDSWIQYVRGPMWRPLWYPSPSGGPVDRANLLIRVRMLTILVALTCAATFIWHFLASDEVKIDQVIASILVSSQYLLVGVAASRGYSNVIGAITVGLIWTTNAHYIIIYGRVSTESWAAALNHSWITMGVIYTTLFFGRAWTVCSLFTSLLFLLGAATAEYLNWTPYAEGGIMSDMTIRKASNEQLMLLDAIRVVATGLMMWQFETSLKTSITNLDHRNRQLDKARVKALEAGVLKSAFLHRTARDLLAPLGDVKMEIDALRRGPPEIQDYLNVMESSNLTMHMTLMDLMDLSLMEVGRFSVESSRFDVRTGFTDVVRMLRLMAQNRGNDLDLSFSSYVPKVVHSDGKLLERVLVNLVSYAIKFTSKGRVMVYVDFRDPFPAQVSKYRHNADRPRSYLSAEDLDGGDVKLLTVAVRNTGPGLSAEEFQQIFDPFQPQAEKAEDKYGGAGLGLAICENLVRLMGGEGLMVRSQPGVGSEFEFQVLVLADELSDLQKPPPVTPRTPGSQATTPKSQSGVRTSTADGDKGSDSLWKDDPEKLVSYNLWNVMGDFRPGLAKGNELWTREMRDQVLNETNDLWEPPTRSSRSRPRRTASNLPDDSQSRDSPILSVSGVSTGRVWRNSVSVAAGMAAAASVRSQDGSLGESTSDWGRAPSIGSAKKAQ